MLDANYNVIEHYMFPSISSGKTMTITPPGAAVRPDLTTSLGEVTIDGPVEATKNEEVTYTLNLTGDATLIRYKWSVTGSAKIIGSTDQKTALVSSVKKVFTQLTVEYLQQMSLLQGIQSKQLQKH